MHWAAPVFRKKLRNQKKCTYLRRRRLVRASASAGAGATKISRLRRAGFLKPAPVFRSSSYYKGGENQKNRRPGTTSSNY
jgi:hypothetical protein